MSNAPRRPMTVDASLAWEERQNRRSEFDGFAPLAMLGVALEHSTIQGSPSAALQTRPRGKPCRLHGPEAELRAADAIRHPDGCAMGSPGRRGPALVEDPVVVFEVLSPRTERVDLRDKLREHRATPAVRRDVKLEQDRTAAEAHAREGDGDRGPSVMRLDGDTLALPRIGVGLPPADLFEGVDLPPLDLRDGEGDAIPAPGTGAARS